MYLGHIGLATQHQTYLWTCDFPAELPSIYHLSQATSATSLRKEPQSFCLRPSLPETNSGGKVQLGSGSGHFALNAEPEPGIRFKFGSAFERVRTQQGSGVLVGLKLVKEPTIVFCSQGFYEFSKQNCSFKDMVGSVSERDSAVKVQVAVQFRLEPISKPDLATTSANACSTTFKLPLGEQRAIWCILGVIEEAEMHNKEEKHLGLQTAVWVDTQVYVYL
ncbi:hypothetical protein B0H13DRAFT_1867184 [Mycena leptocephala]|nr:hypothetical protein B0H13DRAFT_1867184 [Mycena leptocephala]